MVLTREFGLLLRRLHARSGEDRSGKAKLVGDVLPSQAVLEGLGWNSSLRTGPDRRGGTNRHIARVRLPEERLVHRWTGQIDASTRDSVMLVEERTIPDREEALESLDESLMECVNARQGACPPRPASAAAADPRTCRSRPGLPDAQALCAPGALNESAPSVFA